MVGVGVVPFEVDAWGVTVVPSGPLTETLGISGFEVSSTTPGFRAPGGMYALAPRTTPAYLRRGQQFAVWANGTNPLILLVCTIVISIVHNTFFANMSIVRR